MVSGRGRLNVGTWMIIEDAGVGWTMPFSRTVGEKITEVHGQGARARTPGTHRMENAKSSKIHGFIFVPRNSQAARTSTTNNPTGIVGRHTRKKNK